MDTARNARAPDPLDGGRPRALARARRARPGGRGRGLPRPTRREPAPRASAGGSGHRGRLAGADVALGLVGTPAGRGEPARAALARARGGGRSARDLELSGERAAPGRPRGGGGRRGRAGPAVAGGVVPPRAGRGGRRVAGPYLLAPGGPRPRLARRPDPGVARRGAPPGERGTGRPDGVAGGRHPLARHRPRVRGSRAVDPPRAGHARGTHGGGRGRRGAHRAPGGGGRPARAGQRLQPALPRPRALAGGARDLGAGGPGGAGGRGPTSGSRSGGPPGRGGRRGGAAPRARGTAGSARGGPAAGCRGDRRALARRRPHPQLLADLCPRGPASARRGRPGTPGRGVEPPSRLGRRAAERPGGAGGHPGPRAGTAARAGRARRGAAPGPAGGGHPPAVSRRVVGRTALALPARGRGSLSPARAAAPPGRSGSVPMRLLAPFRALRPPPELAPAIASPPYDVVSSSEARAMASGNPKSFFRISRPEVDLSPDVDEHSDPVHARGHEALEEFRRKGWLVLDDAPRFSLYRQRMGQHVQTGLVACASVDAYTRGEIKRHELTRPDKEDDRTRHIDALGANDEPVFLAYRARPSVDAVLRRGTERSPDVRFTSDDGVEHTVWLLPPSENAAIDAALSELDGLYIADGHHRSAAAARVQALRRSRGQGGGETDWFLAVVFSARGAADPPLQPAGEGARPGRERGAAGESARAVRGRARCPPGAGGPAPVRAVPRRALVDAAGATGGDPPRSPGRARRVHPPGRGARAAPRHPRSAARSARRVRGGHPRHRRACRPGWTGARPARRSPSGPPRCASSSRSATPGRSCRPSRRGSSRSSAPGSSSTRSSRVQI